MTQVSLVSLYGRKQRNFKAFVREKVYWLNKDVPLIKVRKAGTLFLESTNTT